MFKRSYPRGADAPTSAGSLQPRGGSGGLDAVEDPKAADRLARLEADGEIYLRLGLNGYGGAEWKEFARALAEYGLPVMRAWIATGMIFTKCAEKGIAVKRLARVRDEDDANEIANDALVRALRAFKDVLKNGRWIASKGASLKTFFIGQCLFQFPNEYRRWSREQCRPKASNDVVAEHLAANRTERARPQHLVELSREAARIERDSPAAIAGVMELGYTAIEIAEVLGLSESAIVNRVYHYRKAKTE